MSFVGRPRPKRIFKSARKVPTAPYSISPDPPMDASLFRSTKLPTKLEAAKLNYDIVTEQTAQKRIASDINTLTREMNNEHVRYRTRKRKNIRGESELVASSPTYSMLKRQKETLQRAQQASFSKLTGLESKRGVSLNPIQKATKSFRGISNRNPMLKPTRYTPVVPGSSNNPLRDLGKSHPSLIPQAFATSAWGGKSGTTVNLARSAEKYYGFKSRPLRPKPITLVKPPKQKTKKVKKKAKKKKKGSKR